MGLSLDLKGARAGVCQTVSTWRVIVNRAAISDCQTVSVDPLVGLVVKGRHGSGNKGSFESGQY